MEYYGTLGPACCGQETLRAMFDAGMTGIRLNLSHGTLHSRADWIQALQEGFSSSKVAAVLPRPQLVIDLQGPELRIGTLPAPLMLTAGEDVLLKPENGTYDSGAPFIPVPEAVLRALSPEDELALDDSAFLLRAKKHERDGWNCRVLQGGTLLPRKSLAILGKELPAPALTAEDLLNLDAAAGFGVTAILQPFVRSAKDLETVRAELNRRGLFEVRIIAKIESLHGVQQLDEILPAADEICIARGDLGNAVPLWLLPGLQRKITRACLKAGKPFMVVTQMLQSMLHSPVPTRAEVNDVYNAVLSGAHSVMLTGETAAGEFPVNAIEYLVRTGKEAEKERESQ